MTHHTEQLHQLLELLLTELDRKAIPIAYMQDIDRKGKAFIEQAARRAPVAPVPQGRLAELKRLAEICPELNMANYGPDDVDELNNWAVEIAQCAEALVSAPHEPLMHGISEA